MQRRVRRRYAAERRFRVAGLAAVIVSAAFLAYLLLTIAAQGLGGFTVTEVRVPIDLAAARLPADPDRLDDRVLARAGLRQAVEGAAMRAYGTDVLSPAAWTEVREAVKRDPSLLTRRATYTLPASDAIDTARKGDGTSRAEALVLRLERLGVLSRGFNHRFFTGADATDPTAVGIRGALVGSLLTMLVTLAIAFPVGTLAALYLEEYAPRNRWTDLIEVSINNLAAVPSIIFGLLGLALFLGTLGLPRSAPLVGGLTLALMTMPVIVVAGRNAVRAVPPSVREAALALGASPVQVVFHHVLPLALSGILTGTIIGTARALGETAPLLMIGMRAFIAGPPGSRRDPATVLPVQIFLWSDQVSRGFVEKTSAAILVLLGVLLAMNGIAVFLRGRLEVRW